MLEVVTLLNKHKVPFNLLNTLRRKIAIEFVKFEEEAGALSKASERDHDQSDSMAMSIIEPLYQETIGPLLSDSAREQFFKVISDETQK